MNPASLLPATPAARATPASSASRATRATPATPATKATPTTRGKHGSEHEQEAPADFGSALASLLSGNPPASPQAQAAAAEAQGAPAPSSDVTEMQATASDVSVAGSGSIAAAFAGTLDASVAPPTLVAAGEPVAAGLRGLTPADQARGETGRAHAPSIAQLPATARPARTADAAPSSDADTTPSPAAPATPSDLSAIAPQTTPATGAPATTVVADSADSVGSTITTTVMRQVFPEIAQVATTPGTHRISITLHPESLGEVKVTVVVRADGVHVRLAADASAADGAQARQALLQGAPELHRLLESTGGAVKIVVQGSQSGHTGPDSQNQNSAQQSPSQGQTQTQAQAGDGQRRSSYTPGNPQDLPQTADQPIGATTTTTARGSQQPRQVDEHAGRLDRLM